jgi:hypothetical protein
MAEKLTFTTDELAILRDLIEAKKFSLLQEEDRVKAQVIYEKIKDHLEPKLIK